MRYLLFLSAFLVGFLPASTVFGLTPQECTDIKDVYGWAPDICESQAQEASTPPTLVTPKSATAQTTKPTAQQIEDHIFFPDGGTNLDATARQQIELLTQLLNGELLGNACLALVGHSDASGGEVANMQVSQARADAVSAALRQRLSDPQKVERVMAAGESVPLENMSSRSRWQRRVEIRARKCSVSM